MARKPIKTVRYLILEDVRCGGPLKVDRNAGVIFGVKILGLDSVNQRRYLPEAVQAALPMYEGIHVNIDHPKKDPAESRSAYDRIGRLVRVRFEPGQGLYGDLEYLKSHPMADRLCEAAERMPDAFGFSHNAQGEGDNQDGVFVIRKIVEVRHVDLVADPATTQSLCESRQGSQLMTRKELIEEILKTKKLSKRFRKQLREMVALPPKSLDASDTAADEDTEDDAAAPDYTDHCLNAIATLIKSGDPGAKDKISSLMKVITPEDDEEEDAEAPMEDDDDASEDDDEDTSEDDDEESVVGSSGDVQVQASTKAQRGNEGRKHSRKAGAKQLTERCQRFCKIAGLHPSEALIESLVAIRDENKILRHLEYLKSVIKNGALGRPRSQSQTQTVTEGELPNIPKKIEDRVSWLLN